MAKVIASRQLYDKTKADLVELAELNKVGVFQLTIMSTIYRDPVSYRLRRELSKFDKTAGSIVINPLALQTKSLKTLILFCSA